MSVDSLSLQVPGEWEHRFVAANGCRFHVAQAGPSDAPLVLLLHGFPQTWYAWRHQIPPLAAAGYRVVSMDLRGFGLSDRPPRGHDSFSLADDVAGVIRALGYSGAVVIGHGYGGQIAWTLPALFPEQIRAIGVLSAPHPIGLRSRRVVPVGTLASLAFAQLPWFPEQRLRRDWVPTLLKAWGAPGWECEAVDHYVDAARLPAAAHHILEQARWQVRSSSRPAGRRLLAEVKAPVTVPVLALHGTADRALAPNSRRHDSQYVAGEYAQHLIAGAGHFLPEEAPDAVTRQVLGLLRSLG